MRYSEYDSAKKLFLLNIDPLRIKYYYNTILEMTNSMRWNREIGGAGFICGTSVLYTCRSLAKQSVALTSPSTFY